METKPRDVPYCGVDKKKIRNATPALSTAALVELRTFIEERYKIYCRKEIFGNPAPWTNNKILREYKFTNVFREDDRVSRNLIQLVSKNQDLTYEEKVLNTFLLRMWNNYHTFVDLGGPWKAEEIYNGVALKERVRPLFHKLNEKNPKRMWFSNAYNQGSMKYAYGAFYVDGAPQVEMDIPIRVFHVGELLKQSSVFDRINTAKSQKEAYDIIRELPGFASFMAYQVFVDLTYIDKFPFSENEFTVAGPGCKRGLDILFKDYDGMTHEEALFFLRDNIDTLFQGIYITWDYPTPWKPEKLFRERGVNDRKLNVMSLENCFCELSKYHKAISGTGRPRRHYKPTIEN